MNREDTVMAESEAVRLRAALEEIVRVATTPDTNVIGTLPGGEIGPIWSVGGQEKAFEKVIRIAKEALEQP
jgi:hypothetical protein